MSEIGFIKLSLFVSPARMWITASHAHCSDLSYEKSECEVPKVWTDKIPSDAVEYVNFSAISSVQFDRIALTESNEFILFKFARDLFVARENGLRLKTWCHKKSIDSLVTFAINSYLKQQFGVEDWLNE